MQKEKPGVRLTVSQVDYATAMLDKYGNDYKVRKRHIISFLHKSSSCIEEILKFSANIYYIWLEVHVQSHNDALSWFFIFYRQFSVIESQADILNLFCN